MEVARTFGKILQETREAKGLSQESLAHLSGYHRTYISLLERGQRTPTLATILRLAATLDISASDLVARTESAMHSFNELDEG